MAKSELTTAAVDILVINRPSAKELAEFQAQWNLHPLDVEEIFSWPASSSTQGQLSYVRLSLVWPEVSGKKYQLSDMVLFVGRHKLAIVTHDPSPLVAAQIKDWQAKQQELQSSATDMAIDLLHAIAKQFEPLSSANVRPMLENFADALADWPAALETATLLSPQAAERIRLLNHVITYPLSRPAEPATQTAGVAANGGHLSRLVGGYALASVAIAILAIYAIKR